MSSNSKSQTMAFLTLSVVIIYVFISIVLYVCLETVDEQDRTDDRALGLVSHTNILRHGRIGGKNGNSKVKVLPVSDLHRFKKQQKSNKRSSEEREGSSPLDSFQNSLKNSQRYKFEEQFPPNDMARIRKVVQGLRVSPPETQPNMPYDIYHCPDTPPIGYPMTWLLESHILHDWNPKDTEIPSRIYQGLCVFDWDHDQVKAEQYRAAELPFVVQNNPEILRVAERWNHPGYLHEMIGSEPQHTEHSKSAHLMYWKDRGMNHLPGWEPPSENIVMTFEEWLQHAQHMEQHKQDQLNREHYYFRLNGSYRGTNGYLYDELPIFHAQDEPTFYMIDPSAARGINCRFGMRGNIAETHYDSSRNWIIVMGGQRRYILAHPDQCKNMELYHFGHPSARHSSIDWTNPPNDPNRPFAKALASEVVLQPGDSLYLPDSYFHFIVSLNINYQCNARSGETLDHPKMVRECELNVPKTVY